VILLQTYESTNLTLEKQIEEMNQNLNELKNNQLEELQILQKNHTINMKKLDKLQEYNKIADMTNQVFERRLSGIEQALKKLNQTLGA